MHQAAEFNPRRGERMASAACTVTLHYSHGGRNGMDKSNLLEYRVQYSIVSIMRQTRMEVGAGRYMNQVRLERALDGGPSSTYRI
jgi:hypothetical protein